MWVEIFVGACQDRQPVWLLCFGKRDLGNPCHVSAREETRKQAASAASWRRSYRGCSLVAMAELWTLPWEWAQGAPWGCSLLWEFVHDLQSHRGASLCCAGTVAPNIGCHLDRSFFPCANSFAKRRPSALELTITLVQSRCPIMKLRMVTAEGGAGAGPASLLKKHVQLHLPGGARGPRAVWGPA